MASYKRRRPVVQAVDSRAVSHARPFSDAGEPFSALPSVPRVPSVHRLFDLDRIASKSSYGTGYGGRPESPIKSLRSVFRSPVVNVGVRIGRPPLTPASQKRIAESWRAFNVLQFNPRTSVCVRRVQRRQVLFAKGVAGYRGRSPGPYRRTADSSWRC